MLQLDLGRLKHNPGTQITAELSAVCAPSAYEYEGLQLIGPVVFSGRAENRDETIQVSGTIQAELALCCSRCGKEMSLPVELPFAEVYSWLEASVDADGERDIHHFEGEHVDLTPEALRLIFWELPVKPLCREDCQGLCPHCGADLNLNQCTCAEEQIDPRWEKLQKLLQDQSAKGV